MTPNRGMKECQKCGIDHYQPKPGQSSCLKCAKETFSLEGKPYCDGCPAGQEMGQVDFHGGEAGASTTEDGFYFTCPFNGHCPALRSLHYWKSKKKALLSKDQRIWYRFNKPLVVVAFSFQANVDGMAPIDGRGYEFFGSNNPDCQKDNVPLHTPHLMNKYFVEIPNKKAFYCYGFKIMKGGKAEFAAIRPPIRVCLRVRVCDGGFVCDLRV